MTEVFIKRENADIDRDAQREGHVNRRGEYCMMRKAEVGVCCHKPRNTWG